MTTEQIQEFKKKDIALAAYSRVLSHPARLAIIRHLTDHKKLNCKSLVERLPLSQASVSQHLKIMVDAEVLKLKKVGVTSLYKLDKKHIRKMEKMSNKFFQSLA